MIPYSQATMACFRRLMLGSSDWKQHKLGLDAGEPVLLILDSLWKYAAAYKSFRRKALADDEVLGQAWLRTLQGVRQMTHVKGAVAMDLDHLTDSKSEWACSEMVWKCVDEAGFPRKVME